MFDDYDYNDFADDDFELWNQAEADDYRYENEEYWECCEHCSWDCAGFHSIPCTCQDMYAENYI